MTAAGLIATSEQRMVLGLGATGCSVARWWRAQGVPFKAADTRESMADSAQVRDAIGDETEVYFGDIDAAILSTVSELVVSPGIALDDPLVVQAKALGIRVIGDIDLFMAALTQMKASATAPAKAPVIGITGSNGKTTVTAMLGEMIAKCGKRTAVGGNLGTPALDLLDNEIDVYVLELSSFQLERCEELGLSVATVLNVSPDHLDRHGSMPRYHLAKHRIFQGAHAIVANRADPLTIPLLEHKVDVVIWRPDEPDLNEFGTRTIDGARWICRGFEPLLNIAELRLAGEHNVNNALAALSCGVAAGFDAQQLLVGLKTFEGLPHRCETVLEHAGVRWINDSKGTNIGATIAALDGMGGQNNVVLIAGGVGKDQDFSLLAPAVRKHCKRVLTLGAAARDIELALGNAVPCSRMVDLDAAITRASELAESGDLVLLSPACASFDMFSSYEARGDAFRSLVSQTIGAQS